MLRGKINLTLLIGVVPVPVPQPITDAITSIQIKTATGEASGFQITFAFSNDSPLNTILILLGQVGPFIRTMIIVSVNGNQNVLIDGVITNHQVTPNVQTGQAVLTVTGSDPTALMDYIDFSGIPYPAMPAEARVALVIAKYAFFGLIPMVIPSIFFDVPIPTNRIPVHQGSDLSYIHKLSKEVGYVFYIEPGPVPGMNIAYWGPEVKAGPVQPALSINMDIHSNVESLSFSFNGDNQSMPIVLIQNELTKMPIPIPIPNISLLNPPLAAIPPIPTKFPILKDTAHLNPVRALTKGLAEASGSADAVTGTGSLNVVRYGHILKARSLVGVRGAGNAFNGLYYVKSVTHNIKPGEYTQDFTLTRNGLVSTVPSVPV